MNSDNPEDAISLCDQRRRILEEDGHMLVVGGPGSGKTTIALLKARRYVLSWPNAWQKVLFLSFSNSAIRRIMEGSNRLLADEIADQVAIKTYHSFAWEILVSHGYLTSSKRRLNIIPAQSADVMKAGLNDSDWLAEQERLYYEEGLVAYDQFAPRAAELLKRSVAVRTLFCKAHPLILVDEFQDTDDDQWALVQTLSEQSDIVGLGDSEQRIFEWRTGVSETRLEDFGKALKCKRFDFTDDNHRSPATGIAGFARSLLSPNFKQDFPDKIVHQRYEQWQLSVPYQFTLRIHLAARRALKEAGKQSDKNLLKIAIAARNNKLVRKISDALTSSPVIRGTELKALAHDVHINQNQILLASRVIANIISNADIEHKDRLAEVLDRIADMFRSRNTSTNITKSDTLRNWASRCRAGSIPTTKCVVALDSVIKKINEGILSGAPGKDWTAVRTLFEKANDEKLADVAKQVRYLRLLRRGSAIEQALIALWDAQLLNYKGAETALERAILEGQLVDAQQESGTISVMNMHQLKGREYDAIVLIEDQNHTFLAHDTTPPHKDTRRLLHMSLTRAREFVMIVSHANNNTFDKLLG